MAPTSTTGYRPTWLTPALLFNNTLIWISAAIVTGITAWFIHITDGGNRHIVYQLVVAVLTLLVYPAVLFLSRGDSFRGYLMPINLVFSYLWLAAFVVSADDWAQDRCIFGSGPFDRCGHKHTTMAFNFIAFFFTAANVIIEGWFARNPTGAIHGEKHEGHHAAPGTVPVSHGHGVV